MADLNRNLNQLIFCLAGNFNHLKATQRAFHFAYQLVYLYFKLYKQQELS